MLFRRVNLEIFKKFRFESFPILITLINRAAAGMHGSSFARCCFFFFSFVGELTKTSARPNAGQDI